MSTNSDIYAFKKSFYWQIFFLYKEKFSWFFFFCLLCNFFIGCQTLWILPYWLLGIFILFSLFLSCVLAYNLVTWKQCDPFEAFVVFLDKARAVFNLWLIFPIIETVPLWVLFWCPMYYKAFPLWLVEIRTLPGSASAPGLVH